MTYCIIIATKLYKLLLKSWTTHSQEGQGSRQVGGEELYADSRESI